ncbi:MAG: hypothetical protein H7Y32_12675, partial [Chloroflexales bacterium]|nr:hypothetical protein [Chloroflexales bacterium]
AAAATDAPTVAAAATDAPTAAPAATGGEQTVTTWYYFDQNNTDEQANERAGNAYLRRAIEKFNADNTGALVWENAPQGYDLAAKLVTAVQTDGDVPDVIGNFFDTDLRLYVRNNTIQDMEWARSEPWFADLNAQAVESCTVDGKLMCVPISEASWMVAYFPDMYPNGFPATPDDLLKEAAALKADGKYALTYWGNTAFDGEAVGRYFFMALSSFGGGYDDGAGKMLLNRPENVVAIEFMREIVKNGYSPESVFAGNFEEEASFKGGTAGAFPTVYTVALNYLFPLTTPSGTAYATNTPKDMQDAIAAGDVKIAPFVAPAGQKPGCNLQLFGLAMPRTAQNVEGGKAYINWIMDPKNTIDWIVSTNGGFPTGAALQKDASFDTEMARQTRAATDASACRPWYGSLDRIPEAKTIITNAIYDLIKTNPDADIAAALTSAQDEYNALPQ